MMNYLSFKAEVARFVTDYLRSDDDWIWITIIAVWLFVAYCVTAAIEAYLYG